MSVSKFESILLAKAVLDGTYRIYEIVDSIDNWQIKRQKEYIDEKFHNLINYCFHHIPYYHKLFIDHGLVPGQFTSVESISKIPILTKDQIRKNYEQLRSDELIKIKYQIRRSGGTTGEPIASLISKEAAAFETFSYFKGLIWMGWKPGMTLVKLFGGSLGIGRRTGLRQKVSEFATDSILIPAFELNNDTIHNHYELLRTRDLVCINGYASAVNILVDLLKANKLQLDNVKLVITTSEQLIDDWRLNIQSYFGCEIRSYYGSGEIGSLGYQVFGSNQNYRIPKEHVYIESDQNTNHLYITQLQNRAQPLIRYEIGDLGTISKTNPWVIEGLFGRTTDLFERKDGTLVSPNFGAHAILKSGIRVKRYQYIQYNDHVIEFRFTMEEGILSSNDKLVLERIINYVMGEQTNVIFLNTDKFVLTESGKHRITVRMNSLSSSNS
ncbi:MAG: hypothetical protein AB9888_03465 [Bacteroidales bacterium]